MQDKVDENLGTEEGKEMKKQRSIQSEGTFGIIKQNMELCPIKKKREHKCKNRTAVNRDCL